MKKILKQVSSVFNTSEENIKENIHCNNDSSVAFYAKSVRKTEGAIISMAKDHKEHFIMVMSPHKDGIITKFSGETIGDSGLFAKRCNLDNRTAGALKEIFPWTNPVALHKNKTIIGYGDRLGVATPGHIASINNYDIKPVLAQQSMKELKQTGRTYNDLLNTTLFKVFQCGYEGGFGADANDLRSINDVNTALAAGMTMITLNLAPSMNSNVILWTEDRINEEFEKLPNSFKTHIEEEYFDKIFHIGSNTITFGSLTSKRSAIMYHEGIMHAKNIYDHLKENCGDNFDFEISVDETRYPTWPECHLFIINELKSLGVEISAFAPHFIGSFKRGIDYIGNIDEFSEHFAMHAEIAKVYGNYKISIHNGNKKYKTYPIINKLTDNNFHLKTSCDSWLNAIQLIAKNDPTLYRVIHTEIFNNLDKLEKLYKLPLHLDKIPSLDSIYDDELSELLMHEELKQILSISYGIVLNTQTINPLLFSFLKEYDEEYHTSIHKTYTSYYDALKLK